MASLKTLFQLKLFEEMFIRDDLYFYFWNQEKYYYFAVNLGTNSFPKLQTAKTLNIF